MYYSQLLTGSVGSVRTLPHRWISWTASWALGTVAAASRTTRTIFLDANVCHLTLQKLLAVHKDINKQNQTCAPVAVHPRIHECHWTNRPRVCTNLNNRGVCAMEWKPPAHKPRIMGLIPSKFWGFFYHRWNFKKNVTARANGDTWALNNLPAMPI